MNQPKIRMRLQCPMPQLKFDVITLGHGGGGLLTRQLLESGVFDLLKNDLLDTHHDGALLPVNGPLAFTTDSYVVSPIFFPGADIGDLAVNGTVNDLAMCGAVPKYLSLAFILEEGLDMKTFWEVLVSIKSAAAQAGVHIVTGDTKVVERGKGDGIFINTSGIGVIHPKAAIDIKRIAEGDVVVISGPLAAHGMAIMSVREGLTFESPIESDSAPLAHTVLSLIETFGDRIKLLRDPTRGGLATVLNEVAIDTGKGIDLLQKDIPVTDDVASACELMGLDPLYVANEGVFMAVVAPEIADAFVAQLRQLPYGSECARVGEITAEHPRQVVLKSRIGGRRVVNMLVGEQLPRIC